MNITSTFTNSDWSIKSKPGPSSYVLQTAVPLLAAAAAIVVTSSVVIGHSTDAQVWLGSYKSPETSVLWGNHAGKPVLQPSLLFPAVREFLNMTPQVPPSTVQAIHDSILKSFPGATISYGSYVDSFTDQLGLRFSVQTGIENFEDLYSREMSFFEQMQPFMRDALKYSIISIV